MHDKDAICLSVSLFFSICPVCSGGAQKKKKKTEGNGGSLSRAQKIKGETTIARTHGARPLSRSFQSFFFLHRSCWPSGPRLGGVFVCPRPEKKEENKKKETNNAGQQI
nr:hypothetical protein [Pandoravirus aubagnensis]